MLFGGLSLLAVGGGTAVIPDMQRAALAQGWMSGREFLDLYALSRIAPGPGSLLVTLIGQKVAGLPGAAVATLAMFVPSCLLLHLGARFFRRLSEASWRGVAERGLAPVGIGLTYAAAIVLIRDTEHAPAAYALTAACDAGAGGDTGASAAGARRRRAHWDGRSDSDRLRRGSGRPICARFPPIGAAMPRNTITFIWAIGIVLALFVYVTGPDRFVFAAFDLIERTWWGLQDALRNISIAAFDLVRAAAIGLYFVFVALSVLGHPTGRPRPRHPDRGVAGVPRPGVAIGPATASAPIRAGWRPCC